MKSKTDSMSVKRIKAYALKIRENLGIKNNEPFPIYDYINDLCNKGELNYQILEDDDETFNNGEVAYYKPSDNTIYVKDSVDRGFEEGDYRSNFTLAHEFFHYIQIQKLNFNFVIVDDSVEVKTFNDPEWQANEFAGELLITDDYLDLDENTLGKMFHITAECALTRKLYKIKREKRIAK